MTMISAGLAFTAFKDHSFKNAGESPHSQKRIKFCFQYGILIQSRRKQNLYVSILRHKKLYTLINLQETSFLIFIM